MRESEKTVRRPLAQSFTTANYYGPPLSFLFDVGGGPPPSTNPAMDMMIQPGYFGPKA